MFRPMRRRNQALSPQECGDVLRRGTSGVLAVDGDGGYPYAVPLSYVYAGDRIYFHCAKQGHKLDAIARQDKVSFCVIDQDRVVPEAYTSYFRSVIAFGRARILEEEGEVRRAIELLAERYFPEDEAGRLQEIERSLPRLCMVELAIEHLSGKQARELVAPQQKPGI